MIRRGIGRSPRLGGLGFGLGTFCIELKKLYKMMMIK